MKLRWTWLMTAVVATAVSMPALAYDHGRRDDHRSDRDAWKQRHDRDDHWRQDQRARWERQHRWERERRERERMEHARRDRERSRDAWERERRERREREAAWRRSHDHRPILRPTSDHPAGWDHGKKTGWGNSDLPPGQARNGDNHGRPFREHR